MGSFLYHNETPFPRKQKYVGPFSEVAFINIFVIIVGIRPWLNQNSELRLNL